MAEELGLHQAIGQRRAIDRHEAAGAPARRMSIAGELLLAGAGLAANKDRQPPSRRGLDLPHRRRHHGIRRDEGFARRGGDRAASG